MECLAGDAVKLLALQEVEGLDGGPHAVVPHERVVVYTRTRERSLYVSPVCVHALCVFVV